MYQRAAILSQGTARLANSFDMPSLMRRMAVIGIPRHLMRWIAFPTPEAYLAIPDWCGMPPYQMLVLNPPRLRGAVVQRLYLQCQPTYWYSAIGMTLDCDWPGGFQGATCYDGNDKSRLAPAFIEHILDLDSWTVGSIIRMHTPDACKIL
ncbi:hypothetical protein E4T52_16052 [Aureobasidium sp. EXF-3400]|nr:hypothetical protein E4T51_15275 [Aureobasidium sp. EXF-12344]KAI4768874.1 hypothetical protein E4T52_16052 [Aureobasidium sp. EXF-3400]